MVTPSGWHEDALRRDAGHDAMHLAVWRFHSIPDSYGSWTRDVHFEWPVLALRGGIRAFADIAEIYWSGAPPPGRSYKQWVRVYLYEIKPTVSTVGGIVRQCAALEAAATPYVRRLNGRVELSVMPVIPHDNGMLRELLEVIDCYRWDKDAGRLL
jgi:hypothetical protein